MLSFRKCKWRFFLISTSVFVACGGEVPTANHSTNNAYAEIVAQVDKSKSEASNKEKATASTNPYAKYEQSIPKLEVKLMTRKKPQSLDEARATLKDIKKTFQKAPEVQTPPYDRAAMIEYAKAMKFMLEQRKKDVEFLKQVEGSKIPGANKFTAQLFDNPKKSTLSRLEQYLPKELENSLKYTKENLKQNIDLQYDYIKAGAEIDLADKLKVINNLTSDRILKSREDAIPMGFNLLNIAILLDELMGEDNGWKQKKEDFKSLVTTYRKKVQAAADTIKPPKDIGDSKLKEIAQEVLSNQKFKFPTPERIIVNQPKRSKRKVVFTLDNGSIVKSTYNWDEFQAASIEQVDGKYFIYYNTIMFYKEGPHTVPTGKWVLGDRFQSSPILKKNIDQ